MRGFKAAAILVPLAALGAAACRHEGPAIVATFDVAQLPPEPAAPPSPEPAAPPAASALPAPPEPAPPSPAELLSSANARLGPVHFDTGRWEIADEALRAIGANAEVMKELPNWFATVEGHADERGSDTWNHVLGLWRAKAVKDQLRALGISPSRMAIISYGKTRPVAPGRDEASLARNRRVEIILHPSPPVHPS